MIEFRIYGHVCERKLVTFRISGLQPQFLFVLTSFPIPYTPAIVTTLQQLLLPDSSSCRTVAQSLSFSSHLTPHPPTSAPLISRSPSKLFIPWLQDWFHTVIPSLKRQTSQQLTSKADLRYLTPSPFSSLIGSNRFLTGRGRKGGFNSAYSTLQRCPPLPLDPPPRALC